MRASAGTAQALIELAPAEWDALLADVGLADPFLRSDYVEAACLLDPGRPMLLACSRAAGSAVFACIVREIPGAPGQVDVTTPYGYGGPVVTGDAALAETFYGRYDAWCRERGVVTTFLRFHPLLDNWRYAPEAAHRRRLADTASWRLHGQTDLFAGMHRSHRNKCRKARAAGVGITMEPRPRELESFVALHVETMKRQGADAYYFFPRAYWELLVARLGDGVVRVDAHLGDELLASALLLAGGSRLYYHMGVTAEAGRSLGASNLLVYEAACWGQEHGYAELHLGSGIGGREDSLWAFKQRFSPGSPRALWIGELVHDETVYAELATGERPLDGYFPAYRRPAR